MNNEILSVLVTFKNKLYSIEFNSRYQTIANPSSNLQYFTYSPNDYPNYDNFEKIKNHIHEMDYTLKKYQIYRFEKNNTYLVGENWYSPMPNCPELAGDLDSRFWLEYLEHILPHYNFNGVEELTKNLKDFDIKFIDKFLDSKFLLVYNEKEYKDLSDEVNKYKLVDKLIK